MKLTGSIRSLQQTRCHFPMKRMPARRAVPWTNAWFVRLIVYYVVGLQDLALIIKKL